MITPSLLKKGNSVGIVSVAGRVAKEKVQPAITLLESWGLNVVLGKHTFGSYHQFAGTDEERTSDLQKMLNNPGIRAVFSSRGGYGTIRLMDHLDFRCFRNNPKWLVGFSDITVLHAYINSVLDIESLHAAMPATFPENGIKSETTDSLRKALFEGVLSYRIPGHSLNRPGKTKAPLVGGNLAVLCSLAGTSMDIDTKEKILFIEDIGEYLYRLDRMMHSLKAAGKLDHLKGLIIGGMTEMEDNEIPFGSTPAEIVAEIVKDYDFPVAYDFPAGHMEPNLALILGRQAHFEVNDEGMNLNYYNETGKYKEESW